MSIGYIYYIKEPFEIVGVRFDTPDPVLAEKYDWTHVPAGELHRIIAAENKKPEHGFVYYGAAGQITGVSLHMDQELERDFKYLTVSTEVAENFLAGQWLTDNYRVIQNSKPYLLEIKT